MTTNHPGCIFDPFMAIGNGDNSDELFILDCCATLEEAAERLRVPLGLFEFDQSNDMYTFVAGDMRFYIEVEPLNCIKGEELPEWVLTRIAQLSISASPKNLRKE